MTPVDRPELIIHLNLPIIQIFYSQICSLLFNNMSLLFKKNLIGTIRHFPQVDHGKRLVCERDGSTQKKS